jgi:hypothetical protein
VLRAPRRHRRLPRRRDGERAPRVHRAPHRRVHPRPHQKMGAPKWPPKPPNTRRRPGKAVSPLGIALYGPDQSKAA